MKNLIKRHALKTDIGTDLVVFMFYSSNGKVLKFQNISQNVTFLIWGGITLLSLEKKALFSHSQNVCCRDLNGLKSLEMTWGGQVLLNFRSSYLQKWL